LDKTLLVAPDFATGLEVVQALDRSSLPISVALWLYFTEHQDWRFVLASPRLDAAKPAAAYGLVHDALEAEGVSLEQTPTLSILKMSDPFIRALRRMFAKTKSVEAMRLGGQPIGDRFVEAAFVFRIR
jgi:hypothetical protein